MKRKVHLSRRHFLAGLGGLVTALSIPDIGSTFSAPRDSGLLSGTGRFGDVDDHTFFDVCIIGSGFAGAFLGEALVKNGIKTAILESGPDPRGQSIDPRFQQLDAYSSRGPIDYPAVATRFRGVGGTSWLWGGMCPRLQPIDLEKNSYTPAGASWPISYQELRGYYRQAARALRVSGGKGSKYHPPMQSDHPHPSDRDVSPLQSILLKAGIIISDIPLSLSEGSTPTLLRNSFGPHVRMTDNHLPAFESSSFASLISGVTVTRLMADDAGYITGAVIRDLNRNTKVLRARVYVIACGGLESPRLLLLSRSSGFPHGLGNNHDLVGRFFMEHRTEAFTSQVRLGWRTFSPYQLFGQSYQFYKESKELGLGGITLRFWLDGAIDPQEIKAGEFGKVLTRFVARNLKIVWECEMKPSAENRVTLDFKAKDYYGNPGASIFLSESEEDTRTRVRGRTIAHKICADLGIEGVEGAMYPWGHHHMGTCRMGDNPRTSVVDRDLQVHGTKNLFVAGSSVFVTSGTANPTLTLTALSLRLSEHLRSQLQKGAFRASRGNRREQ